MHNTYDPSSIIGAWQVVFFSYSRWTYLSHFSPLLCYKGEAWIFSSSDVGKTWISGLLLFLSSSQAVASPGFLYRTLTLAFIYKPWLWLPFPFHLTSPILAFKASQHSALTDLNSLLSIRVCLYQSLINFWLSKLQSSFADSQGTTGGSPSLAFLSCSLATGSITPSKLSNPSSCRREEGLHLD